MVVTVSGRESTCPPNQRLERTGCTGRSAKTLGKAKKKGVWVEE